MIKNIAGQVIGAQMIDAGTGGAFTGTVTVYVTIDGGTQTAGANSPTAEGNGYYSYLPTQDETNGDLIAYTFVGTGAVPATIQVATLTELQTGATSQVTGTAANRGLTVSDLILRALADLNIVQADGTASPDDLQFAFVAFNDLIDDLKNDVGAIYQIQRSTWAIVPNQTSYTVGVGGQINIPRPVSPNGIESVGFIDTSLAIPFEITLGAPVTNQQYEAMPLKTLTTPYPMVFYYSPAFGSTGYGTLVPQPIPTSATLTGVIYAPNPVDEFNALTDVMLLPPGYRRYFRHLLTIEVAAAFGKQPPATTLRGAEDARRKLQAMNLRQVELGFDPAIAGRTKVWNIYTGQ